MQLTLGVALGHLDYEETAAGARLNRESGVLPGLVFNRTEIAGHWRFDLGGSYFDAQVDYDGQTNVGTPVRTDTDARILDLGFAVARLYELETTRLEAGGGIGWRRWWRDIRSTPTVSGVDETYDWPYLHLGVSLERPLPTGALRFGGRLQHAVRPELEAQFPNGASVDGLEPDARLGGRLQVAWIHSLGAARAVVVEAWYEHWRFGASAPRTVSLSGAPVGSAYEPASETDFVGLSLSYRGWY